MTDVQLDPTAPPSGAGCASCDDVGGWWFHLRRCAACGRIGCCDLSPAQHARRHFEETGHRFIRSFEPDEDWFWDYVDEAYADGPELAPPVSRPRDQPVPAPVDRLPADWRAILAARQAAG